MKRRDLIKLSLAAAAEYSIASFGFGGLEAEAANQSTVTRLLEGADPGRWIVINDGRIREPDNDGIYQGMNFATKTDIAFIVEGDAPDEGEQAAFVFNFSRASRFGVGNAHEFVHVSNNESPSENIRTDLRVRYSDYLRAQQGESIPRDSDFILRKRYHMPLSTRNGVINTIDYFERFYFAQQAGVDEKKIVRSSTILRFTLRNETYPVRISSGPYNETPESILLTVMSLNFDVPTATFDMRVK